MSVSPTQRSLKKLREEGWIAEVTERWIPGANIRKDLWGFVDILCLRDGQLLGVQSTSYANVSARVKKIADSELVGEVRKAGIALTVHGWRKVNGRWVCREVCCD